MTLPPPIPAFCGTGAVSPAGWGVAPLLQALQQDQPLPAEPLARPGWDRSLPYRATPPPPVLPEFLRHPRLRRTSPIAHYALASALEAVGPDRPLIESGQLRLGLVFCTLSGSVNYSRRFYEETLQDPAMASPLLFPETVFNAPASHIAAYFQTTIFDYTLVGDLTVFLEGIVLAADALEAGLVDACLVVAAEEKDWLTADALRRFSRRVVAADGAAALYLKRVQPRTGTTLVVLDQITEAISFRNKRSRRRALAETIAQLPAPSPDDLLCDGVQDAPWFDAPERGAWQGWPGARVSSKRILGEGMMAATAWQCVAAIAQLQGGAAPAAVVSVAGLTEQCAAARLSVWNG